MNDILMYNGCSKCPSHNKCLDAFYPNAVHCNHYDRTPQEFNEFVEELKILGLH